MLKNLQYAGDFTYLPTKKGFLYLSAVQDLSNNEIVAWKIGDRNDLELVIIHCMNWSGNERMIRVGEKLGMQIEARIRKVRYHEGFYYDSIRMGILREEWEENELHMEYIER